MRFPGLLFLLLVPAAAQDYFPLAAGDQWIYRCAGDCPAGSIYSRTVTRSAVFEGREYFRLESNRNPLSEPAVWLRSEGGRVYTYDPAGSGEQVRYDFSAGRTASYTGPVGTFDYALEVEEPRELFLPWVGMVQRIEPDATYDLIYARLGDVTVVSRPEVAFGISLDHAVYRPGGALEARLTLRNTTAEPLELTFPSSQIYNLAIRTLDGRGVYTWSADKLFLGVATTQKYTGESNWIVSAPLPGPGDYVVEGWLTTGVKVFSAAAGFAVR